MLTNEISKKVVQNISPFGQVYFSVFVRGSHIKGVERNGFEEQFAVLISLSDILKTQDMLYHCWYLSCKHISTPWCRESSDFMNLFDLQKDAVPVQQHMLNKPMHIKLSVVMLSLSNHRNVRLSFFSPLLLHPNLAWLALCSLLSAFTCGSSYFYVVVLT